MVSREKPAGADKIAAMAAGSQADDDDRALALRASQGDPNCVEQLLVRYLPRLQAFVRSQVDAKMRIRESVSDMVQSTCREVIANGPDFEWQGEARFRGWLFTTALNKIRARGRYWDADKRAAPPASVPPEEIGDAYAQANSPSHVLAGQEAQTSVDKAMAALPEDYRQVVALSRVAELPHVEVARIMGRTEGAVRMLLSRALCELVAQIDQVEGRSRG